MRKVAIVSAVRTPIGKAKRGEFKDTRPDDLLGVALKAAITRSGVNPEEIDDLVVGTAMPEAEQGMNLARIGGYLAGIPDVVPAMTVNRFCASGLQAIAQGAAAIAAGWQNRVLAGGVESMSMIAMGGQKPSPNPTLMAENDGVYTSMGITAENVATQFNISRVDQDTFALQSHTRALKAAADGIFDDEIVPVDTKLYVDGAWKEITVAKDGGPRAGSSVEGLGKLRPAFMAKGSVTAANSSQISDGAAAVLMTSEEEAKKNGMEVLAIFKGFKVVGVDPRIMGVGPLYAIPALLKEMDVSIDEIGHFEINEAFASQALYCVRELGIDQSKVNPYGGAIALGHPLGCTGARLTATIVHAMRRNNVRYGVVSMCIGGGMGAAALFENPSAH
jgi:acetyl-CoA acyltransferase